MVGKKRKMTDIGITIFSVMCIRSIAPINSLIEVDEIK